MSAIVVVKASDRISLLSDRAIYEADGRVVILDRKVHAVASWTGAIHGRGNVAGILIAMQVAESFGSFDEFITASAAALQSEYLAALDAGHLTGQVMIEVHAVGWSEARNRPEAYVFYSDEIAAGEKPVFQWVESVDKTFICSPVPSLVDWFWLHRQGAEIDIDYDAETFDAERHGLPLMEVMRRIRADPDFLPSEAYMVGGGVDLTVITRDGVTQRMIREWPDAVGELILPGPLPRVQLKDVAPSFVPEEDQRYWLKLNRSGLIDPQTLMPRRAEPVVTNPAGMNRHERRALERQQRKAARV